MIKTTLELIGTGFIVSSMTFEVKRGKLTLMTTKYESGDYTVFYTYEDIYGKVVDRGLLGDFPSSPKSVEQKGAKTFIILENGDKHEYFTSMLENNYMLAQDTLEEAFGHYKGVRYGHDKYSTQLFVFAHDFDDVLELAELIKDSENKGKLFSFKGKPLLLISPGLEFTSTEKLLKELVEKETEMKFSDDLFRAFLLEEGGMVERMFKLNGKLGEYKKSFSY